MKFFNVALVLMKAMGGCASDDVVVEGDSEGVVVEDVVVEDLDSAAAPEDDASLDNDASVPTVEEDADVTAEEGPDVSEEEQPEQLDEDPTSFSSTPIPASHFFNPEVP